MACSKVFVVESKSFEVREEDGKGKGQLSFLCNFLSRSIQDLVSEVGIMSAMRHPNLVMLFGCCVEEDNLILIYEYMENGALSRALFGVGDEFPIRLDWKTRKKICLGIAKGVAYLHDESGISIIHRDIKADNILLDRDLNAKVSDFGLSKLITDDHDLSFPTFCGTPGYMAPEILRGDPLTKKVDVFSFGVLIIEIICGQRSSTYSTLAGFTSLVHRVFSVHSQGGDLLELVDSKLDLRSHQEEALALFRVGILCCQNSPTLRPSMLTVVSMLEGQTAVEVSMDVELVGNNNTRGFTDQNSTSGTDVSGAISSIRRHIASGKQPFLGTT
ncbi:hypothetical protein HHK36_023610 [Tetracentron sinense]|uniref:Protein kinase domain-containing protein n=1 Tax=Tetracentron sinense TaxID=13715 RepID=A0A835D605_TETSI|nr:hypothetical protein HHK36_023610 [Tetracentron sinense]